MAVPADRFHQGFRDVRGLMEGFFETAGRSSSGRIPMFAAPVGACFRFWTAQISVIGPKDAFNMKQSAARPVGVPALGAAFAPGGAGVARAAPAVPDAAALDSV